MGWKKKIRDGHLIYEIFHQIPLFHSIPQRTISAQLVHQYQQHLLENLNSVFFFLSFPDAPDPPVIDSLANTFLHTHKKQSHDHYGPIGHWRLGNHIFSFHSAQRQSACHSASPTPQCHNIRSQWRQHHHSSMQIQAMHTTEANNRDKQTNKNVDNIQRKYVAIMIIPLNDDNSILT